MLLSATHKKVILIISMAGILASSAPAQAGLWSDVSSWYKKNKTAVVASYIMAIVGASACIFYMIDRYFKDEKIAHKQNEVQQQESSIFNYSGTDNDPCICNDDISQVLKIENQLEKIKKVINQEDKSRFLRSQEKITTEINSYEKFIIHLKNHASYNQHKQLLERVLQKIIELKRSIIEIKRSKQKIEIYARLRSNPRMQKPATSDRQAPASAFGSTILTPGTTPANTNESMHGSTDSPD